MRLIIIAKSGKVYLRYVLAAKLSSGQTDRPAEEAEAGKEEEEDATDCDWMNELKRCARSRQTTSEWREQSSVSSAGWPRSVLRL